MFSSGSCMRPFVHARNNTILKSTSRSQIFTRLTALGCLTGQMNISDLGSNVKFQGHGAWSKIC